MNLLLDTHVFIWWDGNDSRLNPLEGNMIADPQHAIFVSAASVWEIAIKGCLDKLAFSGSPTATIGDNGSLEVPVLPANTESAGSQE